MAETTTRIEIRYAETDQMGVVHHSHYPVYFEAGRTQFFAQHLMHYAEMERMGLWAPVIDLHMRFTGQARYGDDLTLVTRPLWIKGVRLAMGYVVTARAEVAQGSTVHALVGPDLKPVHPRRFADLYARLTQLFPRG